MPVYRVFLQTLSADERESALEKIDGASFMTTAVFGKGGLEAVDVVWTSTEDFLTSPVFPAGCQCVTLAD